MLKTALPDRESSKSTVILFPSISSEVVLYVFVLADVIDLASDGGEGFSMIPDASGGGYSAVHQLRRVGWAITWVAIGSLDEPPAAAAHALQAAPTLRGDLAGALIGDGFFLGVTQFSGFILKPDFWDVSRPVSSSFFSGFFFGMRGKVLVGLTSVSPLGS